MPLITPAQHDYNQVKKVVKVYTYADKLVLFKSLLKLKTEFAFTTLYR